MIQCESEISKQISSIRKLKMVNCYQVFGEADPIYGIMAYYEDRTINLCNADEHFSELFERIVKIYSIESEKNAIVADDLTRQILCEARDFSGADYAHRFSEYRETEEPLFLPKAFSHYYILPLVQYILQILYGGQEDAVRFEDLSEDWFGQGVVVGTSGGKEVRFPYKIIQSEDGVHHVKVSNCLKAGSMLTMDVSFLREGIAVVFEDKAFFFQGNMILRAVDEGVTVSYCVTENGKTIRVEEIECEELAGITPSVRAAKLTAGAEAHWHAYGLPWGDVIFRTRGERNDYQIYSSRREKVTVSYASAYGRVFAEEDDPIRFGWLAFRLYEQDDLAELHLMAPVCPRAAKYYEQYVGKYYLMMQEQIKQ